MTSQVILLGDNMKDLRDFFVELGGSIEHGIPLSESDQKQYDEILNAINEYKKLKSLLSDNFDITAPEDCIAVCRQLMKDLGMKLE